MGKKNGFHVVVVFMRLGNLWSLDLDLKVYRKFILPNLKFKESDFDQMVMDVLTM